MYDPRFELAGFSYLSEREQCPLVLLMVQGLVEINRREIRAMRKRGSPLPPLYRSGVIYYPQGQTDDWKDALAVLDSGGGSCNSLAAWRVAELLESGEHAGPYIQTQIQTTRRGERLHVFHVIVWIGPHPSTGNPLWECPSRTLGMQSEPYD